MAVAEPTTGTFVEIEGLRTFYIKSGTGPALFLIHGASPGGSSQINWGPAIDRLGDAGFTVYAFDQPGFGYTDNPTDYSMEFRVAHARSFIRAMGTDRYNLMGNSMGAYVAARLALEASDRVNRLVLVGSATLAPKGSAESEAIANAHAADLRNYTPGLENIRELSKGTFWDQANVTEEFVQLRYEMSIGKNWEAQQQRAAAGGAMRVIPPEELGSLKPKTLIVWGANDRGATVEKGLLLFRAIPGAEMHVFDGASHWPQWDCAARFASVVGDFLAAD